MVRFASRKLENECFQVHSSFKLGKNRKIIPFCSGE